MALSAAAIFMALGAFLYIRSQDTRAPALTAPVVERLLRTAVRGLQSRSPSKTLSMVTEDAMLFGFRRAQMERILAQSMHDLSTARLVITWQNLQVADRGNLGTAEFDVTVAERMRGADAVYVTSHITLELERVRRPRWLGLGTEEAWLVRRALSSMDLMLGD
jgi:hypothetical protein